MKLAICILLLLVAGSAAAQDSVVRAVKARLEATGVPLDGPCGAFEITKRVAWQLRATGAGTLDKPSGNNCGGRSVDIIAYPDGRLVDILSDAGGSNGPVWNPIEPVDASRWRAPMDPGDSGSATGPGAAATPVVVQAPAVDLSGIVQGLEAVRTAVGAPAGDSVHGQAERVYSDLVARLEELRARQDMLAAQLKAHDEAPTWLGRVFGNRYTQIVMGAAAAWVTAQQTGK